MITFVIPTWNRASALMRCVQSIATQNPHRIIISDNASTDATSRLVEQLMCEYPCVSYHRREQVGDYQDSFKTAFNLTESEWTWTFGDDDLLLPGALAKAEELIAAVDAEFYHVAEQSRVARPAIATGTLLELCQRYGWIDVTGYISGNIVRTSKLKQAVNSENWTLYGTSSFAHSCALLETLGNDKAVLAELPLVSTQSDDPTEETIERWGAAKITYRYLLVADALKVLQKIGAAPEKVEEDFYRYLNGSLFFRLMHDLVVRSLSGEDVPSTEDLERIEYLTSSVAGDRGAELASWGSACTALMRTNIVAVQTVRDEYQKLVTEASRMALPHYATQYIFDKGE